MVEIEKIISWAIGLSGTVKPELQAKAVLKELERCGYVIKKIG